MGSVADVVLRIPAPLALTLVFLLPALEASTFAGFLVPAEPAVVVGGVLAHEHRLPLWAVLVASVAGALVGDSIGYELGRRYGRRLTARVPHRLLRPAHLERAEAAVRRGGGRMVFVGRFTTTLRVLVPGAAGLSRVPYRSFLVANAAGGLIWAVFFTLLGYLAGQQWRRVSRHAALAGLLVGAVVVLVVLGHWAVARRNRRPPRV